MKKKVIISLLLITSLFFLTRSNNTTVNVGIANESKIIDINIEIDDEVIFSDSVEYSFWEEYINFSTKLNTGLHTFKVTSDKANITLDGTFWIFLDQHLVFEYYPYNKNLQTAPCFYFRNRLFPFYYE